MLTGVPLYLALGAIVFMVSWASYWFIKWALEDRERARLAQEPSAGGWSAPLRRQDNQASNECDHPKKDRS